ncbi:MAG TPA: hypothetical protein VH328_00120, partial [Burkholderiaceae bacterium]|nr:hypothetical protein [Burkholderiaceae bacterium]
AVVVFVDFGDPIRSARSGLYAVQPDHQGLTPVDQSARRSRLKLLLEGNRFYNFLLEHSQLLQLVRVASVWGSTQPITTLPPPPTPQEAQAEQEITRLLFRRMAAWCKARDIQLTVLTTGWDNFEFPWMGQMMREEGVTFHDLHDSVATVTGDRLLEDYSIPIDTHPNARGDGVIANAAWPILDQRLRGLPARPFSGF